MAFVDTGSEKVDLEVSLLSSQKYYILLYFSIYCNEK